MQLDVRRVDYREIQKLRDLHAQEATCQLIRYSMLPRGLADAYLVHVDGRAAAYGGVMNQYDKGRLVEFYTVPEARKGASAICRELCAASGATSMQAQTNVALMRQVFFDCTTGWEMEKVLFEDGEAGRMTPPTGCVFRRRAETDAVFEHSMEPVGKWVIETGGRIVATGGWLTHYNPPYADLYMEVGGAYRGKGFGSYLVQEVKLACREAGLTPAARCDFKNVASRRTLEQAGLRVCGHLLVGAVKQVF